MKTGELSLRFEDVAQDGRVMLEPLVAALGTLWRALPASERRVMLSSALPIISRITATAGDGPFGIDEPLDVEGDFSFAHDVDASGAVSRVFLDAEATLTGRKGRTNGPLPDDAGAPTFAGSLRVEHVFTRPFAEANERKVTSLVRDGVAFVPPRRRAWREPQTALEAPPGGTALDGGWVEDASPVVLGLGHTDSNQHVNSLFYPRTFEDYALRHLARHGRSTAVLARSIDIAFRRPSFAGESLRVRLRAYEAAGGCTCVGAFLGAEAQDVSRARVFVRLTLG